jgi:hypothetical protein
LSVAGQSGWPWAISRKKPGIAEWARACADAERPVTVLHVGDLDPSGVHMALNVSEDVAAFADAYGADVEFHRLAVTPPQVKRLRLPTAPAKTSDDRAFTGATTQAEAIAPDELARIIGQGISAHTDMAVYERVLHREQRDRRALRKWLGER